MVGLRTALAACLAIPVGCLLAPLRADDHPGHGDGPHPNDPVLRAEHMKMLDLVTDKDATHTAAADGA